MEGVARGGDSFCTGDSPVEGLAVGGEVGIPTPGLWVGMGFELTSERFLNESTPGAAWH